MPVSPQDMSDRGWDFYDFLYVIGDAYVDHPSFGPAIISRVLEDAGYRVCILSQPNWKDKSDFAAFPRPRLGVLICAGNIDTMVNHYTVSKKVRSTDAYSPGGVAGRCPDRATIVYANRIRETFGNIPLIIGGIEASLRRFAHYDYWDNKVRRSIMLDSRADILLYGMGEKQIVEVADRLRDGVDVKSITDIPGSCYIAKNIDNIAKDSIIIPSYEECCEDKMKYALSCKIQFEQQNPCIGKTVIQPHADRFLVQNKPAPPLNTNELDKVYSLPYTRAYHPSYESAGGVPAIIEVKFSIASSRGCFGGCNFCALAFHQGRIVTSRSHKSIIDEAKQLRNDPEFKGYIHDVGGPTANFRKQACKKQSTLGACANKQCLFPEPCSNMDISHADYLSLLRKLRKIDGIKKVFVRSGIRFDYLIADKDDTFFRELCEYHVSGQLKVAPEHVSDNVLKLMGKPSNKVYNKFQEKYYDINKKIGKKQFLVPYLMSAHPGSTLNDAIELALYLKNHNLNPQQVQDFYPTPGTVSTCMFYTGINPLTMQEVYVAQTPKEKAMQRALLQYKKSENHKLVVEALKLAGRDDLIGYTKNCLVTPLNNNNRGNYNDKNIRRKSVITKNKKPIKGTGRQPEKR